MERRNTVQKTKVLEAVQKLHNHASAEEIFSYLSAEDASVSRATVYRNLGILAEEGKIRRIEIPGEADRFDDDVLTRHFHMRCVQCGRLYDVESDPIPDFTGRIKGCEGMKFLSYDIVFKGICSECSRNSKKE